MLQNTSLTHSFCNQVNEIAWNTTGEIFFLTTGNGKDRYWTSQFFIAYYTSTRNGFMFTKQKLFLPSVHANMKNFEFISSYWLTLNPWALTFLSAQVPLRYQHTHHLKHSTLLWLIRQVAIALQLILWEGISSSIALTFSIFSWHIVPESFIYVQLCHCLQQIL